MERKPSARENPQTPLAASCSAHSPHHMQPEDLRDVWRETQRGFHHHKSWGPGVELWEAQKSWEGWWYFRRKKSCYSCKSQFIWWFLSVSQVGRDTLEKLHLASEIPECLIGPDEELFFRKCPFLWTSLIKAQWSHCNPDWDHCVNNDRHNLAQRTIALIW